MENDLHQAFYGVFCSSKEIIKNNQRHLYVNMLDLLGRTCRATGLAESKIGADSLVKFWIEDILPLVFDNDKTIQTCAVNAVEQGLSLLEVSKIHGSKYWPEMRANIVSTFPDKIHQLRSNKNKHWHQIWCLVIRILDREILNGAAVINSFLSTVELGFRSSDCNVRAETFLCWRLLIKIFHSYNELLTPKRLKLICIPLKSTQSKSASLASVKIRVWWYFITCIGEKLGEHFTKVVEPFLFYAFGSPDRDIAGDVQQYDSVKIMAVLCLAQILLEDRDKLIDILISENSLETLIQPSPLLSLKTLKDNWKSIVHSVLRAIRMLVQKESGDLSENHDTEQHLSNWLVLRLVKIMLQLNYAPCTQEVCKGLITFLPAQTLPINTALNCLASTGISIETSKNDIGNFSEVINSIVSLLIASKPYTPAGVLHRCIEQIAKTPQVFEREQSQQQALCAIIKEICSLKDDEDCASFETKLLFWKRIAQTTINFLSEKNLSYRRKDFADVINSFVLWPLRYFASFTESSCFSEDFCALWRQLILCGQNAPGREKFLNDVQKSLKELISTGYKEMPMSELVNAYVIASLKLDSGKNSTNINDILLFLRFLFEQPNVTSTKSFEAYLNTLSNVFLHMQNNEICEKFELVKSSIAHVVNIVAKDKPSNAKAFNDWKGKVLERFRTLPQKNYSTQIREILKNDVFVIIPSVWILNPEKLTERQKERFAERSDIPALYNDMSQSQDSSIKPWTPKKIVIAKNDQTEITIGSNQAEDEEMNKSRNTKSDASSPVEMRSTRRRCAKVSDVSNENNTKPNNSKSNVNASSSDSEEPKANNKTNIGSNSSESTFSKRTRKSLRSSSNKNDDLERNETDTIAFSGDTLSNSTIDSNNKQKMANDEVEKTNITPNSVLSNNDSRLLNSQETPSNTETQILSSEKENSPDEIISESQFQNMIGISEKIVQELETNLVTESMEMNLEPKEFSPKKTTTKIVGLSSPPDRKSTNNSCSPSLRPKPTPHLTRGAQLINMIRSKMKVDGSALRTNSYLNKSDRREGTPVPEGILESSGLDHMSSTPLQKKELLTFKKRLPSPSASPSASILKRKLRRDSFDDISTDSPATKRKRVSFHDPPVSVTKEYVRDVGENQLKPKRCLALDKVGFVSPSEIRYSLKRRNKMDSMAEIENFSNEPSETQKTADLSNSTSTSSARKISLSFEDQNNGQALSELCQPSSPPEDDIHTLSLPDPETALKVVVNECPLETVLEKYFSSENIPCSKSSDTLAKFVSKCMTTSSRVKSSVLEVLSENHSKDFLNHAVQENLSSVVCDRLNLDSVIDYICAKSKLNTSCRNSLLAKMPEVLKHSKVDKEPLQFIMTLIEQSLNPNDGTILDLIAFLMHIRNERQSSTTPDMDSTDVSSSNL